MVQQLARDLHRKKGLHILLKLDISKAFDSVSWSFLLELLQHLGFGRTWCNLICLLLSTSSTRIVINGDPGEFISHRRGLWQGDPLSPMLSILVMEALNAICKYAGKGITIAANCLPTGETLYFLYADDVAMFLRPSTQDLSTVLITLNIFGHA